MTQFARCVEQLPVRRNAAGEEIPPTPPEVNRVLSSLQRRLSEREGRAGTVETVGRSSLSDLQLRARDAQDIVPLGDTGGVYYQGGQLWGHERVPPIDGGVLQKVAVLHGAEHSTTYIGKASRTNYSSGLDASLDRQNDRIDVVVDPTDTIFYGIPLAGVRVYYSGATTVNTGTPTLITFDLNNWNTTPGFHFADLNPSRLTVPAGLGGYYSFQGGVRWAATATAASFRTLRIEKNSAGVATTANILERIHPLDPPPFRLRRLEGDDNRTQNLRAVS